MRTFYLPTLILSFAASPTALLNVPLVTPWRGRGARQALTPQLPNGDPLAEPPVTPPSQPFPTDVPVPEPKDVPPWEPSDVPPPDSTDPKPRHVP